MTFSHGLIFKLSIKLVIIFSLIELVKCGLFEQKLPQIVDPQPIESNNVRQLLADICWNGNVNKENKQISRISTIITLAEYLEALKPSVEEQTDLDANLYNCLLYYSASIRELNEIVTVGYENVCSDQKVSLIEDFHNDYISTTTNDLENRRELNKDAPQLIKLFFMHYAMEVSAVCKRSLINNLEWDLKDKFDEQDYQFGSGRILERVSAGMAKYFADSMVDDYDDVVIIWDLIDTPMYDQDDNNNDDINPLTNEPIKLYIKTRDISTVVRMQQSCATKFKPVYEKLIAPIVRLSDMGYSNKGQQFTRELQELRENKIVQRWYNLTQICEAILPIKFFQDSTLELGDTVVIEREEARKLAAFEQHQSSDISTIEAAIVYDPTTNSMEGIDVLEAVSTTEAQTLVKKVKTNMSSRERALQRMLVHVTKSFKGPNLVHLFFSYKSRKPISISRSKSSGANELSSSKLSSTARDETGNEYVRTNLQQAARKSYAGMNDSDLLKLQAGAIQRKPIKRQKLRQRKVDSESDVRKRDEALSYMHTKSWGQIFHEWVEQLAPSRKCMVLIGALIIIVLLVGVCGSLFG